MGATTDEDDVLDITGRHTCIGQLLVDVGDDLTGACTDVVSGLTSGNVLNRHAAHVARIERVVDVLLHALASLLELVQAGHDVAGEVAATQRQRVQIDERLVLVDGHRCGLGAHVNEHAAQLTVTVVKDLLAHCQRSDNEILDRNAERHQTVQVKHQLLLGDNEININFYGRAKLSYGVGGCHFVHIVCARHNVHGLVVAYRRARGILDDALDEFIGDGFGRSHATLHLAHDAVERPAAHAHIDLSDASVNHRRQIREQTVDDALDVFYILYDTIPHAIEVLLLLEMFYAQESSRSLLGNGCNYLRASDFKCYDMLFLFHKNDSILLF